MKLILTFLTAFLLIGQAQNPNDSLRIGKKTTFTKGLYFQRPGNNITNDGLLYTPQSRDFWITGPGLQIGTGDVSTSYHLIFNSGLSDKAAGFYYNHNTKRIQVIAEDGNDPIDLSGLGGGSGAEIHAEVRYDLPAETGNMISQIEVLEKMEGTSSRRFLPAKSLKIPFPVNLELGYAFFWDEYKGVDFTNYFGTQGDRVSFLDAATAFLGSLYEGMGDDWPEHPSYKYGQLAINGLVESGGGVPNFRRIVAFDFASVRPLTGDQSRPLYLQGTALSTNGIFSFDKDGLRVHVGAEDGGSNAKFLDFDVPLHVVDTDGNTIEGLRNCRRRLSSQTCTFATRPTVTATTNASFKLELQLYEVNTDNTVTVYPPLTKFKFSVPLNSPTNPLNSGALAQVSYRWDTLETPSTSRSYSYRMAYSYNKNNGHLGITVTGANGIALQENTQTNRGLLVKLYYEQQDADQLLNSLTSTTRLIPGTENIDTNVTNRLLFTLLPVENTSTVQSGGNIQTAGEYQDQNPALAVQGVINNIPFGPIQIRRLARHLDWTKPTFGFSGVRISKIQTYHYDHPRYIPGQTTPNIQTTPRIYRLPLHLIDAHRNNFLGQYSVVKPNVVAEGVRLPGAKGGAVSANTTANPSYSVGACGVTVGGISPNSLSSRFPETSGNIRSILLDIDSSSLFGAHNCGFVKSLAAVNENITVANSPSSSQSATWRSGKSATNQRNNVWRITFNDKHFLDTPNCQVTIGNNPADDEQITILGNPNVAPAFAPPMIQSITKDAVVIKVYKLDTISPESSTLNIIGAGPFRNNRGHTFLSPIRSRKQLVASGQRMFPDDTNKALNQYTQDVGYTFNLLCFGPTQGIE